jgi:hypothetical protein
MTFPTFVVRALLGIVMLFGVIIIVSALASIVAPQALQSFLGQ